MKNTLKDIITALESFSDDHININSFSWGSDISQLNTKEDMEFPLIFAHFTELTYGEYTIDFEFEIYCATQLKEDLSNLTDGMTNMSIIGSDILSYFFNNTNLEFRAIVEDVVATPLQAEFDSKLVGVNLPITFQVENSMSMCQIPLTSTIPVIPPTPVNLIANGTFTDSLDPWIVTNWIWKTDNDGEALYAGSDEAGIVYQTILESGKSYNIKYDLYIADVNTPIGNVLVTSAAGSNDLNWIGGNMGTASVGTGLNQSQSVDIELVANGTHLTIYAIDYRSGIGNVITVDNVEVYEV